MHDTIIRGGTVVDGDRSPSRPPSRFQWGWNTLPVVTGPGARLQQ
jgi:hypothetical protein